MQIRKIVIENFKQYKKTAIEFPTGLIGFIGKNGSGKSTIFETISNAFYGKFETNKEQIRNDRAPGNAPVIIQMWFEDKGDNYKIVREYRGKNLTAKADLYKNDNLIASGANEVNKRLIKILKIDYKNFKNSFFARQKEVTLLLSQGAKDRQIAIRKMLGLERMDKIEEKIKNEIKEQKFEIQIKREELLTEAEETEISKNLDLKKEEIKKFEVELSKEEDKLSAAKKNYEKIKNRLSKIEKLKEQNDKLEKAVELKKSKIENEKNNLVETEEELLQLKLAVKEYKKLLPEKSKYEKLEKEINRLQKVKNKFIEKTGLEKQLEKANNDIKAAKEKLKIKNKELEKFQDIDEKLKELFAKQRSLKNELKTLNSLKDKTNKLYGSIKDRINDAEKHLKTIIQLGKDSNCPTCERPLEDHYDFLIEKYNEKIKAENEKLAEENNSLLETVEKIEEKEYEIERIEVQITNQEKRKERREGIVSLIEELKEDIVEFNKDIASHRRELKKLGEIKFDENDLLNAKSELKKLNPSYKKCLSLSKKKEEIAPKEKKTKDIKTKIKSLDDELKSLFLELKTLNFNEKEYLKIKKEREIKEEELNELKESQNERKRELTQHQTLRKEYENKLKENEERKKRIARLEEEIELYDKLKMTVAVIKEKITSKELPEISAEASNLFSAITKGRYADLRIDENFNFKVNRDGLDVDLETLSGGEQDLAALCIRISISERISKLAGRRNMGFLALDEVFGSQDEDRREELLGALHEISEKFNQIFIVSHNRDVQEEFPNRLIFSKSGEFSKVESAG